MPPGGRSQLLLLRRKNKTTRTNRRAPFFIACAACGGYRASLPSSLAYSILSSIACLPRASFSPCLSSNGRHSAQMPSQSQPWRETQCHRHFISHAPDTCLTPVLMTASPPPAAVAAARRPLTSAAAYRSPLTRVIIPADRAVAHTDGVTRPLYNVPRLCRSFPRSRCHRRINLIADTRQHTGIVLAWRKPKTMLPPGNRPTPPSPRRPNTGGWWPEPFTSDTRSWRVEQ